jgi:DNA replication protein DnaC
MEDRCPVCRGTGFAYETRGDGVTVASPCGCAERDRTERLLHAARIPRRYEHCGLDNYEPQNASQAAALRVTEDWVERWPLAEQGLLFLGGPGTGKTHLAVGLGRRLVEAKGAKLLFYEQRELLKELQATFDADSPRSEGDVLQPVLDAEVLILDDLGAGRTTAWAQDVMHDVIACRYNEKRPLIMTSNRAIEGGDGAAGAGGLSLRDRLGDALISRLYEMCVLVEVRGEDFRKGVLNARHRF